MPVSTFGNWLNLSKPQPLSGPEHIINEATKRNFTFARMWKGRPKKALRGGEYITERVKLVARNSFRTYEPGEIRTPGRSNTISILKYNWAFYESDGTYTHQEVEFNGNGDQLIAFKNFRESLMQDLITDHANGFEGIFWKRPDATTMEAQTNNPKPEAFSFLSYIVEDNDGTNSYLPPGWSANQTTLANIVPNDYEAWRNVVKTYDHTDPYGSSGIFQALDAAFQDIEFDNIPNYQRYGESDDLQRLFIFTNGNGRSIYQEGLREGNDQFRAGPQDPAYGRPVFMGVPIDRCSELDTNLLNETNSGYTDAPYTTGQPRYFLVNGNHLYPVGHENHFFERVGPIDGGATQRDIDAMFMESRVQNVCTSRRRQAVVRPANRT